MVCHVAVAGLCFHARRGDCVSASPPQKPGSRVRSLRHCVARCISASCSFATLSTDGLCSLNEDCPDYDRLSPTNGSSVAGDASALTSGDAALTVALHEAKRRSSRSGSSTACEAQAAPIAAPPEHRPAEEARGATGLRVGLATLYYAPLQTQQARRCHALGCALLAWCAGANRLRHALPWQTEVLVLEAMAPHGTARSKPAGGAGSCAENAALLPHDCRGAVTLRPSPALEALVQAHVAAQVRRQRERRIQPAQPARPAQLEEPAQPQRRLDFLRRLGGQLYKWELFSVTRLDAVLFADLDVDLFPPRLSAAAVADEWGARLPVLLGARPPIHLVGRPDFSSPINGGLFLLRPSEELFRDGLRTLAAGFDEQTGWNRSGTPASLLAHVPLLHHDGQLLTHGHGRTRQRASVTNDAWDWVAAELDQGLLVHMLLVRHNVARYALGGGAHSVDHFWGMQGKPWKRVLVFAAEARRHMAIEAASLGLNELCPYASWLERSLADSANDSRHPPTPCARLFASARDTMRAQLAQWRGHAFPRCLLTHCHRTSMNEAPQLSVF